MSRRIRRFEGWFALFLLAGAARAEPPAAGASAPAAALRIAAHDARSTRVVDGDTLRLPDGTAVRILALDAEEVFHNDRERAEAAADFAAYARSRRKDGFLPVKFGTPAGEAAKEFARRLVASASEVRVERDAPRDRTLDLFGRVLGHVVLVTDGRETLFAEEMIRNGHSPYFVKYGRSVRFDARLKAAEQSARKAGRGIWGAGGPPHYPDYAERLSWWSARADQVDRWRASTAPNRITLGVPEDSERLDALVGRDVVLFGELNAVRDEGRPPWILWLHDRKDRDLSVVFFDPALFRGLDRKALASRYLTVRGRVSLYLGRPQVVVERAGQVSTD